jgi:hypothetical protein
MNQGFIEAVGGRLITARRLDAEAGVDLRKWRAWFDDESSADKDGGAAGGSSDNGGEIPDWVMKDPAAAYREKRKADAEAAEWRIKLREAERKLAEKAEPAKPEKPAEKPDPDAEWKSRIEKLENELKTERVAGLRATVAAETGIALDKLQDMSEDELKTLQKVTPLIPKGTQQKPNTTGVPGGRPAEETDAQKRARLNGGGGSSLLRGGKVIVQET